MGSPKSIICKTLPTLLEKMQQRITQARPDIARTSHANVRKNFQIRLYTVFTNIDLL